MLHRSILYSNGWSCLFSLGSTTQHLTYETIALYLMLALEASDTLRSVFTHIVQDRNIDYPSYLRDVPQSATRGPGKWEMRIPHHNGLKKSKIYLLNLEKAITYYKHISNLLQLQKKLSSNIVQLQKQHSATSEAT